MSLAPAPRALTLTSASAAPELAGFVLSGLVVLYGWERFPGLQRWIDEHVLGRLAGLRGMRWDWRIVALILGGVFVAAAFVQSGPIACASGEDDTLALLQSGQNFLTGVNPFVTFQCGHSVHVPYGIASVLLDALGSLGGRVGIWLVWNLIALLLIPLTWLLATAQRWYATMFVATSMLYAPLVVGSIQGGHSAIVPVTALLGVWLALRRNPAAGTLAGLLSTVKFPSLFPFWGGLAGTGSIRWRELLVSAAVFGALSLLVGVIWGNYAYQLLFTQQLTRVDFSINEFGVLIPLRAMPPALVQEAIQGVGLLAALVFVYRRRWPAVPAVALLTIVVALVAQRFTQNFMIWLLPVALLGPRYCRWVFALGAVGVLDAAVALPACTSTGGCVFSETLAGVFGLILLILLIMILRSHPGPESEPTGPTPATMAPTRPKEAGAPAPGSSAFHSAPRFESEEPPDRSAWGHSEPRRTPTG